MISVNIRAQGVDVVSQRGGEMPVLHVGNAVDNCCCEGLEEQHREPTEATSQ